MILCVTILAMLGTACLFVPLHIEPTGVCLLALAALLYLFSKAKTKKLRVLWLTLAVAGTLFFSAASGYVLLCGRDICSESSPPQTVIVLGAQIHGDRPSRTLRERLDRAAAYAKQNPGCTVFVTGGRGADEQRSEASVMADYLLRCGVEKERVFAEEQAHTTRENLKNTMRLAEENGISCKNALIVTSDFHLCRAFYIARSVGMEPSGLVSKTQPAILRVNYALREVFSFVKAFWQAKRG